MLQHMGNMILRLREEMGMSQECLARGLVNVAELSRLENGTKEMDCFVMEALFQRLGKSVDKFEMMVSDEEYGLMLLRTLLLKSFWDEDYEEVGLLLEEYERQQDAHKPPSPNGGAEIGQPAACACRKPRFFFCCWQCCWKRKRRIWQGLSLDVCLII